MKFLTAFWQPRSILAVFAIVCLIVLGVSIWNSTATQAGSPIQGKGKQNFQARIRNGLGHEVQFARASASLQQVNGAIDSIASFIASRSGLAMSDATKQRLTEMEHSSLNKGGQRITVEQLSDALTNTLMERLPSMTDKDIAFAIRTLEANHPGQIFLRANGEGYYKNKQFVDEINTLRSLVQIKDSSARKNIYETLSAMVKDRVTVFSEAVPEQFGGTINNGLTPLQALLITYSLAADDYLTDSRDELKALVVVAERQSRSTTPGAAYGVRGRLFSTPLNLVFNQEAMSSLFDRLAKGGNEK